MEREGKRGREIKEEIEKRREIERWERGGE